jgi:tetratricopeptide (TPR) repeat protein
LKERWEPVQMLGFWLPALRDRSRADLAPNALRDAERVLADESATARDKAKAELIRGLALRNEEKYDRARESLEKARAALRGAGREWREAAEEALKEVSNPGAYYAGRAEELYGKGDADKAREALKRGMEVLPKEKGRLLARRSLIALERAREKGTLSADDPLVEEARKDADAAARQGSAEGHYAAGRIAEELGRWGEAVSRYRAAVKAHPELDDAGSRYRAALARALLRSGSEDASRPSRRSSSRSPGRGDRSLDAAVLLLALTLQAPGAGESPDSRREAEKLADEILAAGDKVPFDVRAQALAVKGLYTPALRTYAAGLREKGLLPAATTGKRPPRQGEPKRRRGKSGGSR